MLLLSTTATCYLLLTSFYSTHYSTTTILTDYILCYSTTSLTTIPHNIQSSVYYYSTTTLHYTNSRNTALYTSLRLTINSQKMWATRVLTDLQGNRPAHFTYIRLVQLIALASSVYSIYSNLLMLRTTISTSSASNDNPFIHHRTATSQTSYI